MLEALGGARVSWLGVAQEAQVQKWAASVLSAVTVVVVDMLCVEDLGLFWDEPFWHRVFLA